MNTEAIDKMDDGKDKELMKILSDGAKPYIRKQDGYAKKIEEDKEITYKDHNDQELTLKVPSGSYLVTSDDGCYPKIVTSEEFESKNKFVGGEEKPKEKKTESKPSFGIESMEEGKDY